MLTFHSNKLKEYCTSMNDIVLMTPFNGFDELENVVSGRKVKLGKSISGQSIDKHVLHS